jgi:ATP-dependent RNA helicase RhlE
VQALLVFEYIALAYCIKAINSMKFSDLNLSKFLLRALDDMGLEEPTPIQEKAFSVIMSGKDVVGTAQTGTGKTLAYLLPCLRMWRFQKHRFAQVLILVPTRELVTQIVEEIEKLTTHMTVVAVGAYGGVNIKVHTAEVEQGLDILVGTPGRVYDLALNGSLKLKHIQRFVIDEVDEMLELGFRTQLNRIIELLPPKRQNLLFSATITESVQAIIDEAFDFPVSIEAAPLGTPLENIKQWGYKVPNFYTKINLLQHILQDKEAFHRVLVFAPSKRLADLVIEQLDPHFPEEIGVIHANKSQNYRFNSLRKFQSNEHRVLIATDLVSRGLDLSEVSHVINLDTPEESETYIHRIGRTGRADQTGTSITFTTEKELPLLEAIEALMKLELEQLPLPEEVEISELKIPEEEDNYVVKNVDVKVDMRSKGAFHEKKKSNTKTKLTREELREQRGRKKQYRKKRKKKRR